MPHFGRIFLVALLLAFGLPACGQQDQADNGTATTKDGTTPEAAADDAPQPPAVSAMWTKSDEHELTFHVWRMHCDGCAKQLSDRLESVEGVTDVFVDRPTAEVVIEFDASTDVAALKDRLVAEIEKPEVGKKFAVLKP